MITSSFLTGALALGSFLPSAAAPTPRAGVPVAAPAASVAADTVAELLRSGRDRMALGRALFALGGDACPELFAAFAGEFGALDPSSRGACSDALQTHVRGTLVALLTEQTEAGVARRAAAVELLADGTQTSEVELLFALAGSERLPASGLLDQFERAVRSVHATHASSAGALRRCTLRAGVQVQDRVLRAVRSVVTERSLQLLAELTEGPDILAAGSLRALGDLWAAHPGLIEAEHTALAALRLEGAPGPVHGPAAIALGKACETGCAERLIELLELDEPRLTRDVHWALQNATGLGIEARAELWRDWFTRGQAWWTERSAAALDALDSGGPAEIGAALREIAEQRLDRRTLAAAVARTLDSAPVRVAVLCCATLGQLGCSEALPTLLDRVEDPVAHVAEAARQALIAITGLDAGAGSTRERWVELLAPEPAS